MSDCKQVIGQLQEHLRPGGAPQAPLHELLQHVLSCARCRRSASNLATALRLDAEDTLSCAEVGPRLPEFSLADQSDAAWADLRLHLAMCGHCAIEYLELRALERLAEEDPVPVAQLAGKPRLDFLPHHQQAARPAWRIDELGRLIVAFSREVLAAMLANAPAPPALAVKTAPHTRPVGRLTLGGAPEDLEVRITIDEREDEPGSCALTVEVHVPSRQGWPNLAGSEVRAAIPGRDELVRLTDAFGRVAITPLTRDEVASLTLTIAPVA
jgi:hypothetical protein